MYAATMPTTILILTLLFYSVATMVQIFGILGYWRNTKQWVLLLGFIAVCLQGLLLHQWINVTFGQSLSFFNLFSLTTWLIAVLVLVMSLFHSIDVLVLFLFPAAVISILMAWQFPEVEIFKIWMNSEAFFHILLSIMTFCVLSVAGLLALLLAVEDFLLRQKRATYFIEKLPPLESLERILLQINGLGFVLLSVLITTSLYFYYDILWHSKVLLQKTFLAVVAWLIFTLLLLGRFVWGWRGRKVIYGTLVTVMLLFIAYFGSRIVLRVLH